MKTSYLIAVAFAVFFILLITLGFSVNELVAITKIDTPTQPVALAASYAGYYLSVKCIILTLVLYLNGLYIYDYFKELARRATKKAERNNAIDSLIGKLSNKVKEHEAKVREEYEANNIKVNRDGSIGNEPLHNVKFSPKLDN